MFSDNLVHTIKAVTLIQLLAEDENLGDRDTLGFGDLTPQDT